MKKYLVLLLAAVLIFTGCTTKQTVADNMVENTHSEETFNEEVVPLKRNDISLYLSCQYTDEKAEKNILLVHGLTYSSHQFDNDYDDYSLSKYLAGQGYKVWLLDIAGYGRSGKVKDGFSVDSDYAAEDIAAAAETIIKKEKVQNIDVLGWSWGTVTTSRFVRDNSKMVNKLILYAPIITGLGKADVEEDYHTNTWEHAAGDFQKTDAGDFDDTQAEQPVIATYLSNCWKYDGEGSPNGARRDLLTDDLLIDEKSIPVKTLVIYGDKDEYINKEAIDAMKLPEGSEKVMIPGASHVMMLEKPYYKKFRESVMQFLNK